MATVRFTENIQRHVPCPTRDVPGATLGEILDEYFQQNERARGYVLDDQGQLREHIAVFIDGELVRGRRNLKHQVAPDSIVDLIQALSGG